MIPKVIHYFWFGGNPLPKLAQDCIESWKHFMPDYEIRRWDETNFDVNQISYTREAYEAKKWAYVSDYARIKVLYEVGGVYLDTDVELIKSLDPIISKGAFMACERKSNLPPYPGVATGLGIAVEAHHQIYKDILDYYQNLHFYGASGSLTVVEHVTTVLIQHGLKPTNMLQELEGITIYPPEYFCPFDKMDRIRITNNTVAIHHYAGTWLSKSSRLKKTISKILGPHITYAVVRFKDIMYHRNRHHL
jgi:mannosyltransferase OCH1-like enzyme